MKDAVRTDARRIRRLRRQEADADAGASLAQLLKLHLQSEGEAQPTQEVEDTNEEKENELNDWGIEHRTCPPALRTLRATAVDRVIAAVLAEQAAQTQSQSSDQNGGRCTILLRLTSRRASQVARSEALDRGRRVERACRRWSATDAGTTTTAMTTSTQDLPNNDEHHDNESDNDHGDNDMLAVADTSLDASSSASPRAVLRRRRSFLRRRWSATATSTNTSTDASTSSTTHPLDNDMMGRRDSMLQRNTPQDTPHVLDGSDNSSDGSADNDNGSMTLAVADASLDASAPRALRRRRSGGSATTSSPLRRVSCDS